MLLFLHFLNFTLRICNPFIIKERKKLLYNRRTQFCYSPKSTLLAISSPTLQPANSYYIMARLQPHSTNTQEWRKEKQRHGEQPVITETGKGQAAGCGLPSSIEFYSLFRGTCTRSICMCVYMSMLEQHIGVTPPGTSLPQYSPQHQARTHRSQTQLRSGRTGHAHLTQLFNGHYQSMRGVNFLTYTNKSCGCLQSSQTGPGMQ